MSEYLYDAFISHASEDKEEFVLPLVHELQKYGLKIWFDKFSLKIGDSLRESIEMGLSQSRFGVVIFSHQFLAKNWPKAELNGLFAREISGQKVILPVWHHITREDMLKHLPIQADKVAAKSSDGVSVVARALVEVIRPEALELDTSRADAEMMNARFLEQLRQKHPGYDFRVTAGVTTPTGKPDAPGIIASRYHRDTRIDILIKDRQLIENEPKIQVHLSNTAINKIKDALRTGRPQKFSSGELVTGKTTVPLMNLEEVRNLELLLVPRLTNPGRLIARVTFGMHPNTVTFPVIEFTPKTGGTEEAEIVGKGQGLPFELYLTLPLSGERTGNLWFSVDFKGCEFTKIQKFVDAMSALKATGRIEITNLETDAVVIEAKLDQPQPDLFTEALTNLVKAVDEISRRYGIFLPWPEHFEDRDLETIAMLQCLIEGTPFGSNLQATVQITKRNSAEENSEVLAQLERGEMSIWLESQEVQPVTLFGMNIPVGPFGLFAERTAIKNSGNVKNKFLAAAPGDIILVEIESQGPVFIKEFSRPEEVGASK